MEPKTASGKISKHKIMLYTISTCIWCRRLKNQLSGQDIKYSYIDIDLIPYQEKEQLLRRLREVKPRVAFPMMFVDEVFIPNMEIDQKISELVREG